MPTFTICVASTNPVKLCATENGFRRMFPDAEIHIHGLDVPSGVSAQPFGSEETLQGAEQRVAQAARLHPQADFWVGIEGGVEPHAEALVAFAWMVVKSATATGRSRTGSFYLPSRVTQLVQQGKELGEADDIVFGRSNSKQANGAIGILTGDVVDRTSLYEQAIILALVPFKNPQMYGVIHSDD